MVEGEGVRVWVEACRGHNRILSGGTLKLIARTTETGEVRLAADGTAGHTAGLVAIGRVCDEQVEVLERKGVVSVARLVREMNGRQRP